MATKRLKSEDRRKQILECSASVFSKNGLAGTKIRDIALACNINEAVIYKHFASKDDLFKATIVAVHDDVIGQLGAVINNSGNGLDTLKQMIDLQMKAIISKPHLKELNLHMVAAASGTGQLKDWVRESYIRQNNFIRTILMIGISDGSIRNDIDVDQIVWRIRGIGWTIVIASLLDLDDNFVVGMAPRLYQEVFDDISNNG